MIGILQHGIVQRLDRDQVRILRPGKNGGQPAFIEVPDDLANEFRLANGDIVAGHIETIEYLDSEEDNPEDDLHLQLDEPAARRSDLSRMFDNGAHFGYRLCSVSSVNGVAAADADDRPYPVTKRNASERTRPDRWLSLATGSDDCQGKLIDFAAPLGAGVTGAITGPHGVGLSSLMATVLKGIQVNSPDCIVLLLAMQCRAEEVTALRRRFPNIDIVVAPPVSQDITPTTALMIPNLMLQAALRQTEFGRDVVLAIDSLTALWGALLEAEDATAQFEADHSGARRSIRDYIGHAGCFHGESPLGGGCGGSLTIIGTVWDQPLDADAEEDRETHPHLRLIEHIVPDLSWRVVLDPDLARRRLYPAIDISRSRSNNDRDVVPADVLESIETLRAAIPRADPAAAWLALESMV